MRSEKGEGWAGRTADPLTRHELDCRKVGTRRAQRGWEPRYFAKNLDRELRPSALSLDSLPRRRLEREAPRNVASNRRAENAARHSVEGRGGSGWRVRSQWVVPVSEVVNTGAAEGRGRHGRPVRGAKCGEGRCELRTVFARPLNGGCVVRSERRVGWEGEVSPHR